MPPLLFNVSVRRGFMIRQTLFDLAICLEEEKKEIDMKPEHEKEYVLIFLLPAPKIGHVEIARFESNQPFPTFQKGDFIDTQSRTNSGKTFVEMSERIEITENIEEGDSLVVSSIRHHINQNAFFRKGDFGVSVFLELVKRQQ